MTNVGLTDRTALLLAEVIEKSKTLRVLNVETNFISPPVIVTLVKALLKAKSVEEFRASNQVKHHFYSAASRLQDVLIPYGGSTVKVSQFQFVLNIFNKEHKTVCSREAVYLGFWDLAELKLNRSESF